jgi:hypothetical protein
MKRSRDDAAASDGTVLSALLGQDEHAFFEHSWETAPARCSGAFDRLPSELQAHIPSFDNLCAVLHTAAKVPRDGGGSAASVLCFKDQHPTAAYSSPAAAYLDGCSLVVNHAEAASDGVARLCRRLRESFPHAFGNLYLTPPRAQAVDAHADDRDVIVVQLEGTKHWTVYHSPPIPFPTADEQVGKLSSLPVPKTAVAEAQVALRTTLRKGTSQARRRGAAIRHAQCMHRTARCCGQNP